MGQIERDAAAAMDAPISACPKHVEQLASHCLDLVREARRLAEMNRSLRAQTVEDRKKLDAAFAVTD